MLQIFLKVNCEVIVHSQLCGELTLENFDSLLESVGSSRRHICTKNSQINSLESLARMHNKNSQEQLSIVLAQSQQQHFRAVGTYAPTKFSKANTQKQLSRVVEYSQFCSELIFESLDSLLESVGGSRMGSLCTKTSQKSTLESLYIVNFVASKLLWILTVCRGEREAPGHAHVPKFLKSEL